MAKDPRIFEGGVYFLTLTVAGWTDVFIRGIYRDLIVHNLKFCVEKKGLEIYAFCLMTNHLHMIAACPTGDIGKVIREFKSFSGKELLRVIEENPQESRKGWLLERFSYFGRTLAKDTARQFWDRENYPEEVWSDEFFRQKERYIHENPMRAGLVLRAEDWAHSSACPECPLPIVRF
jgi:putative transposase